MESGKELKIDENFKILVLYSGSPFEFKSEPVLLSNVKYDWNSNFNELLPYINDDVLDKSETNASSIILVAEVNNKKILLPGDSTPDVLLKTLKSYNHGEKMNFDLVKLPHHGSYKNITHEILDQFKCNELKFPTPA